MIIIFHNITLFSAFSFDQTNEALVSIRDLFQKLFFLITDPKLLNGSLSFTFFVRF